VIAMIMSARAWSIDRLNTAPDGPALRDALRACCAAESWIDKILRDRPYPDRDALARASDAATVHLDDTALAQALAGHPRIGDRTVERSHGNWSGEEQSGMSAADTDLRRRMDEANRAYEERFGHVYLVCATGKSASELLDVCQSRLAHDPVTERAVVLGELAKINRLRLGKLLGEAVL
jgi:2-oxo-4-hydroxy-4-carboxy-5-ureidoimidazoline decarboxylase